MTPEEFVSCIRREVLEKYLNAYRDKMEQAVSGAEVGEPYWLCELRTVRGKDEQWFPPRR